MGQHQAPRAIGDALLDASATNDVLLVVRARADDEAGLDSQSVANRAASCRGQDVIGTSEQRLDSHQVSQLVGDALSVEQPYDLAADVVERLLVEEATI